MQAKINDDSLDIPDFLRVQNRNKKKAKPGKAPLLGDIGPAINQSLDNELDAALEGLLPETAALLRSEIATHRFQKHWLRDPVTILVFEREHQLRKAKKEAKNEERMIEKKINANVRASLKVEFGTGIKIIVLNRDPKRQPGAARIPRFASLLVYLEKNPEASVAEIFKNTEYIKSDFMRDQRLKIIKTDVITATKKGK